MRAEDILNVIEGPHISEKATMQGESTYVFRVKPTATKKAIKHAIQDLFKVQVSSVQTSRMKGAFRRFKQKMGRTKDFKKAYVTVAEGQKIDFDELR